MISWLVNISVVISLSIPVTMVAVSFPEILTIWLVAVIAWDSEGSITSDTRRPNLAPDVSFMMQMSAPESRSSSVVPSSLPSCSMRSWVLVMPEAEMIALTAGFWGCCCCAGVKHGLSGLLKHFSFTWPLLPQNPHTSAMQDIIFTAAVFRGLLFLHLLHTSTPAWLVDVYVASPGTAKHTEWLALCVGTGDESFGYISDTELTSVSMLTLLWTMLLLPDPHIV